MRTRTVGKRMVGSDWRWWRVILGAPFLGVGLGLSGLALSWVSATAVWPLCLAFGLTILAVGTQASFGHRRIVLDRENGPATMF